jgi:signal transduction histidine kinase
MIIQLNENTDVITEGNHLTLEKQLLALDALSKLTRQFSKEPDFNSMIEILMLTISGQFSIANAFVLARRPGSRSQQPEYFATGTFKKDQNLQQLEISNELIGFLSKHRKMIKIEELELPPHLASFVFILGECGTKLICPLIHNNKFLGLIGLGGKVTKKPFTDKDFELFDTLANIIIPFWANSYLFWEIAGLKTWYLDIINSVKQGIFVFDQEGRLKKVNDSGFSMLKKFKSHLTNANSLNQVPIELIFPENVFNNWAQQFRRTYTDQNSTLLENMVARTEESKYFFNIHMCLAAENLETGSDLILTIDDITELKDHEQHMFQLEKMADKGIMASSIAHELNNFLGMILGGVELSEMEVQQGNIEKSSETIAYVRDSVLKMTRYTKGLMDYGKLETKPQIANLNRLINDVISFIGTQKKFIKIKIQIDTDIQLPKFEMDTDQISQLMLNLLNNAADAIYENETPDGFITVGTMYEDETAILSITDNGCGIEDNVKRKLFNTRLTTKNAGHGYGLVTCGKIIKNHHATIDIDTELGKGTTFLINFPLSKSD